MNPSVASLETKKGRTDKEAEKRVPEDRVVRLHSKECKDSGQPPEAGRQACRGFSWTETSEPPQDCPQP